MLDKILPDKAFLKNSITVILGVGISQIIVFLFQLITRRLYSPAEFGTFDVYYSIITVLTVISCLRYEAAIVLPKRKEIAANVLAVSFINAFIINALVLFIIIFFRGTVCKLINFPIVSSSWLFFLPITTLFYMLYFAINYWFIREKAFGLTSWNKISRRIGEGSIQVIAGIKHISSGLVFGDLAGNFLNSMVGLIQLKIRNFSFKWITRERIRYVYKRYSNFPKYTLVPHFLNTLSYAIPLLLINKFYGEESAGFLGFSRWMMVIPLSLISVPVSQVLLQRISQAKNSNVKITSDIFRIVFFLGILSLFGFVIIYFWGVEIFEIFFGETWKRSGEIAKILILSFTLQFVVTPLSSIFISLEKINVQAYWQIFYFVIMSSLFIIGSYSEDVFIKAYLIIDIIAYLLYFFLILREVRKYDRQLDLYIK